MTAASSAPHPPAEPVVGPRSARTRGRVPSSPRKRGEGRGEGPERRVCVGAVTGPHGVHGAVRIKTFTEVPEDIARYGPLEDESGRRCIDISLCGAAKGLLIARLSGIKDRDQAEALRGQRLYVARAALPRTEPGEYYHADLIGLVAVLGDGTPVGQVRAIYDFGSGDTLELARPDGPPLMVPFTRAVVPVVEPEQGRLVLEPPPGLLDDGEP